MKSALDTVACGIKKMFLKMSQNEHENTYAKVPRCRPETLAQVFSYEFCEIFKNSVFTEHLWMTVSVLQVAEAENSSFFLFLFKNQKNFN